MDRFVCLSCRNVIIVTISGVFYRFEFHRLMGVYIGVAFSIDQGPRCCFSFNMVLHQTDWCDARPTGGRWDYSRAYSVRIMKRRAFSHSLSTLVLYIADRYKIPH